MTVHPALDHGGCVADVRDLLVEVLGIQDRATGIVESTPLLTGSLPELDSMALLELVYALEERFGIRVSDDEVVSETFETLGTLAAFVAGKQERRAA